MTNEEAINQLQDAKDGYKEYLTDEALNMAIKALEQETVSKESYDHEYFLRKELEMKIAKLEQQEPFINKPCISSGVCEHDKNKVLNKIRAEIQNGIHHFLDGEPIIEIKEVLQILDKYKAESEE